MGHANEAERARIAALEAKLLARSTTIDERLELSLLNLEPLHDGFRAAELLKEILLIDPQQQLAKLWLAYTYIYELMDEGALKAAVRLCNELLRSATEVDTRAAAHLLRASALLNLGSYDLAEDVRQSVALAPQWVSNRQLFAKIHEERGDLEGAKDQLRKAIEATRSVPKPVTFASDLFEMLITARRSHRIADRLEIQLRELGSL